MTINLISDIYIVHQSSAELKWCLNLSIPVSPLWTFKKSWVYCGHATTLTALTHVSLCDKMAVAFRYANC